MQFTVTSQQDDGRTVVSVTGEIDVYTAPALQERMYELMDHGHRDLVVDLATVEFVDSSGLGVLVAVLKRVRSLQGRLRLVCDRPNILNLFLITGLTGLFQILPSLDPSDEERAAAANTPGLTAMVGGSASSPTGER